MKSVTLNNLIMHGIHFLKKGSTFRIERSDGSSVDLTPNQRAGDNRTEVVIAAKTLLASDSGKTLFLNLAAGFATALPLPGAGLRFRMYISLLPTGAHTIVATSDIMVGGINELEVDTADDGPSASGTPITTITFSTTLTRVGDYVDFESDGTSWFFVGQTSLDGAIALS